MPLPNTHRRRDSTVDLSRVGSVNAPVGSHDPVYNFLYCWAIGVGDKWRRNDVIVEKLSISIKIHVVKPLCSVSMSTESVSSRRELVANCVHTADADATQLDSWVASASAVCVRLNMQIRVIVPPAGIVHININDAYDNWWQQLLLHQSPLRLQHRL